MLPLCERSLRTKWCPQVPVVDASAWGGGVSLKFWDPADVAAAGRVSERWRYRSLNPEEGARAQVVRALGKSESKARPWDRVIDEAFDLGVVSREALREAKGPARDWMVPDPGFKELDRKIITGRWWPVI